MEKSSSLDSLYYSPTNSDTSYYSPTNSDSPTDKETSTTLDKPQIFPPKQICISCHCINSEESCLIFYFNMTTEQFESIDCKKFSILINSNK